MFKTLDDQVLVAGQITAADVADAKAQGVARIVNNRPEHESPDQTSGEDIAAAAAAAEIDYVAAPMAQGRFGDELIETMAQAFDDGAKTLIYCRSGTRSTLLWGLARASRGVGPAPLIAAAAAAGYDLESYGTVLGIVSAQAREKAGHA